MQDKTWYSILRLDAEPLFLQDDMLSDIFLTFQEVSNMLWSFSKHS